MIFKGRLKYQRLINPNYQTNMPVYRGSEDSATVWTAASPITNYPNTALPNSTRQSIPHNIEQMPMAHRFGLYYIVTRHVNWWMSTLKCLTQKERAMRLTSTREKGLPAYQNCLGDRLFPCSRVVLGMNLLTPVYRVLWPLSIVIGSVLNVWLFWFAMLYENRWVIFKCSNFLEWNLLSPFGCCLRHLQPYNVSLWLVKAKITN